MKFDNTKSYMKLILTILKLLLGITLLLLASLLLSIWIIKETYLMPFIGLFLLFIIGLVFSLVSDWKVSNK